MSQETGITPLPWSVNVARDGKAYMHDASGKAVIVPNMSATGRSARELDRVYRQIVKAVNNHQKLVEALKQLADAVKKWHPHMNPDEPCVIFSAWSEAESLLTAIEEQK